MLSAIDNDKPPVPPQYFERGDDFRNFRRIGLGTLSAMTAAESAWKLNYSSLSPSRQQAVEHGAALACAGNGVVVMMRETVKYATWRPSIAPN